MEYLANGTENYAIIGSFSDSLKLQFLTQNLQICDTTGRIYPVVYFFIDDVSILEMQYVEPKIPNVFSPNNDGVNEAWIVEFEEEVQCIIYNRWGNIIYNQKDKKIIWNGNDNCDGIYYYIINSNRYNYKGFIQLLR